MRGMAVRGCGEGSFRGVVGVLFSPVWIVDRWVLERSSPPITVHSDVSRCGVGADLTSKRLKTGQNSLGSVALRAKVGGCVGSCYRNWDMVGCAACHPRIGMCVATTWS